MFSVSLSKKTVLSSPAIMLTRSAQKTFLPEASLLSDRIEAVIITDDHATRATQTESFSLCGKTNQRHYRESSHNETQRQKQWALPLGELFDYACEQACKAVTFRSADGCRKTKHSARAQGRGLTLRPAEAHSPVLMETKKKSTGLPDTHETSLAKHSSPTCLKHSRQESQRCFKYWWFQNTQNRWWGKHH